MSKINLITYTVGLICYSIIIGFRIQSIIENQNSDTWSALMGWLMLLIYFIAFNTEKNKPKQRKLRTKKLNRYGRT